MLAEPMDVAQTLDELAARLPGLTVHDEHVLRRRLARARRTGEAEDRRAIAAAVDEAEHRLERRRASVPMPTYPQGLPVAERREDLVAAIRDHQVVIVAGETGSGKSTQLPKLCLEAGRGVRGLIGHTQPRRLAARTIAQRVAEELGGEVGDLVGFAVRFTHRVGERTLVKVMTDGILLAELQRDRDLRRYDTIIVDEAHERSLNTDFLLGYLCRLLPRRPDLKVIVTSATIDTERFARHFGDAPVVSVSGRTYPVELRYRPYGIEPEDERDQTAAIADAVIELAKEGPGDVLVFLSGEREIRDTADALERLELPHTELLPLYARLSAAEQHRVFAPHKGRRIVLATNVAETSLTVPGIRTVIDPGTARISRYNRRTKVQRLPIEAISRASADQRAGRCGRVGPGICIRLYSEEDYEERPAYTEPEILRTNLASVILQMAAIGLGDVAAFPFVEPPDARSIGDGVALLEELGAIEPDSRSHPRLTPIGRRLASLPVDPRLGRMALEAEANGCVAEVAVIAAALSIQDPRERPTGKEQRAAELHRRFADPDSDFVSYLRLWEYLAEQQAARSSSAFRRLCRSELLHHLRVREWQDVHGQLLSALRSAGIRPGAEAGSPDAVHRSLLAGLLSHIGHREGEGRDYLGARSARFSIAPGSVLFKVAPRWVMVAELVETNRLWGRVAARVQPEWAERAGAHLVRRSYGEPWWDADRGAATVHERVTLYGVPVVAARPVPYARVDPPEARAMFLRHALVEGDWSTHHAFVAANAERVAEVAALEDRARRRDILVDEDARVAFFDARVPASATSARAFDRWWRDERTRQTDLLTYSRSDLIEPVVGDLSLDAYPTCWHQGELELPLSYLFDPGEELDGVTVDVSLPVLERVASVGFDWQVPGLRAELVAAVMRSAPAAVRRQLAPAAPHVSGFLGSGVGPTDGPLVEVLAAYLSRSSGVSISAGAFSLSRVPAHLRMTFRVVSERGTPLAWSKDLEALRDHLRSKLRAAVSATTRSVERGGLTDFPSGGVPRTVSAGIGGHPVVVYPALVDEGGTVAIRTCASPAEQQAAMWVGTRRLLLLNVGSPVPSVERRLGNQERLALASSPYSTSTEMMEDCSLAALDQVLAQAGGPAWDEQAWRALEALARRRLADLTLEMVRRVVPALAKAGGLQRRLTELTAEILQPALIDIAVQVARLLHPGFVTAVGIERLDDLVRYLQAADRRLDRLPRDPQRDRTFMERVAAVQVAYDELVWARPGVDASSVRWAIEELRVSLFAQSLGTAGPVSEKRIMAEIRQLNG